MKMFIPVGRIPKADGSGQVNLLGTSIFNCFCTMDRQVASRTRDGRSADGFLCQG